MNRRDFIKTTAAGVGATAALDVMPSAPAAAAAIDDAAKPAPGTVTASIPQHPDMKYRRLGRTGEAVSLVGMGGFHLAKPGGMTNAEAIRVVHAGLDAGINFCDNCWDYNGGESEVRLGRALSQEGYRNKAFLMTKIDGRTAQAAMGQIETSLTRLKTDHLDLLQFHEIIRMDDPERVFAAGGALEAVLRAREQGKLRYIGFTGHKSPKIHAHMFAVADQHDFHFDTVQMPLNIMDAHYDSFEQTVVPIALAHDTGIIGMKAFGDNFILKSRVMPPIQMLQYPMGLPVSLQVTGIDSMPILHQALQAVRTFTPPSPEFRNALLARSAEVGRTGSTEHYKISGHFDGTGQNPQWLTEA
ncbi:aldo/keto reductase [Lichenicoccus roseus]|uniref:Aldo/keto reductase n=1 Tax=Lichenicoccus roseus TaxID=2683649 RepID=A0A5R9JCU6_9PROT|nr:aldo/keto reductase [Lichenicoccus roseus]TLU72108.1 aldo/keto reductase [Lichenicoccus roseus]